MYKIIEADNRVNYGVIDEPVAFNYKDYKLLNFFGKEIKGLRKKFAFHRFNFVGVLTDEFMVCFAAVGLEYLYNCFGYLFHYTDGLIYEFDVKGLRPGKKFIFPADPDEYTIQFKNRKSSCRISKSHQNGCLDLDLNMEGRLRLKGRFTYGLKSHSPLRVLNPSEPYRWTFTEKCSAIIPQSLEIIFKEKKLGFDMAKTTLLYDWSGGYMRRETNWYWAALSGILSKDHKTRVGANFAALTNESFYPENAFWINGKRTRVSRTIYDFDFKNLYRPWHVWDEDGRVDLRFFPMGERSEKINALILKSSFHQMIGKFEGRFTPLEGDPLEIQDIYGFAEFHRALW